MKLANISLSIRPARRLDRRDSNGTHPALTSSLAVATCEKADRQCRDAITAINAETPHRADQRGLIAPTGEQGPEIRGRPARPYTAYRTSPLHVGACHVTGRFSLPRFRPAAPDRPRHQR
jgi:hypothetical protein